jgi:hypothetical protein
MVDVQTVGVMVTATSVSVAAIYYIMTLRVQQRNMRLTLETRRIGLIDSLASRLQSPEGSRIWIEVINCEWKDYEDYVQKYGPGSREHAMRQFIFGIFNNAGAMLRKGMVEAEDLYDHFWGTGIIQFWAKYGPVLEVARKWNGRDWLMDVEYLAGEMLKVKLKRDPAYKVLETPGVRLLWK